ncbi:reverse transcriptase domain-containing protein, partial [Klebsiella pneumoniae]|uniref:RNA-directed DNA polymerase n=1 Tax=Klebsiella pneumoniae TaxID=573 RepID=UPI003EBA4035
RGLSKRTYKQEKIKSWNRHKKSIEIKKDIGHAYKKINKLQGKFTPTPTPILRVDVNGNQTEKSNPQEVAEIFANHFAEIATKTARKNKREYQQSKIELERMEKTIERRKNDEEKHPDNRYLNEEFTKADIQLAISQSKKSAPGPDMITNLMLSHLTEAQREILLKGINKLFSESQYLEEWGVEIKLPFLKPGKNPKDPSNYRGISLTSSIGKLMERMVSNRITWFLEKNEKYNPAQSGFRKGKSTMDAVYQLVANINKAMEKKNHLTAVFFDLEKAYDTIWRSEVIKTLIKMGIRDQTLHFFKNFLNNRRFIVKIGSATSAEKEIEEGIPQGSVLSVVCFALAINDIYTSIPEGVEHSLYVDDLVIYVSAKKGNLSDRRLQGGIFSLEKWAKNKGVNFSKSKTVAIKFQRRKNNEDPKLYLDENQIQVVTSTKYLGMVIDSKLNWSKHIEHLRNSCIPGINLLRIISGLEWSADRDSLYTIFQALVLSKLDYGSQFYSKANDRLLRRIETIQNECLRICSGAFKSSPITSLQVEMNTPPLKHRRDMISLKYLFKMESNPQSLTYRTVLQDDGTCNPMREELIQLRTSYSIPNPQIQTPVYPMQPQTLIPPLNVCNSLPVTKKSSQPEVLKLEWLKHREEHTSTHWYTDGSKTADGVGYAIAGPHGKTGGKLPAMVSVYTAEMYAISTAVN